ncbi:GNAT family N-acetyltransferase [Agromyces sp. NPDC058484]|uniref:GNAT family N-acetyltransferase n=1 Tax=Agromyces sp. NPDC058484 TaxID=3346524 RepID=UPI0036570BFD
MNPVVSPALERAPDLETRTMNEHMAPPSLIFIRQATPADAALVDEMVREIAHHEGTMDAVVATTADWERMLGRADVTVLLAFAGLEPIGYVSMLRRLDLWLGTDVIGLDDLWIRPLHRNRGAGELLMNAVAELAADDALTVVWGAQLGNEAAHRFYRRLGAHLTTKVVAAWTPERYLGRRSNRPDVRR